MGRVREPRGRGASAVGSRYRATTGEDTADSENVVPAVVSCRVRELAIALYLLVVTFSKCSVNLVTNPKPVCSHTSRDSIVLSHCHKKFKSFK
jgi:hypothetical protein